MIYIFLTTTLVNVYVLLVRAGRNVEGVADSLPLAQEYAPTRLGRIRTRLRYQFGDAVNPLFLMIVGVALLSFNDTVDSSTWLHSTALTLIVASIVHHHDRLRASIVTAVNIRNRQYELLHDTTSQRSALDLSCRVFSLNSTPRSNTRSTSSDAVTSQSSGAHD